MDDPLDQTHTLWGALVGGPDIKDWHRDITKDYVYNEVAVDYNAAVVGDLAGLYYYYGTEDMKPEENFPPKETPKTSFWIEGNVIRENEERSQITVRVHNDTTQPPRYLYTESLKARYYFDITELIEAGQSIEDVRTEVYYDEVQSTTDMKESAKVSQPIHLKDNVYYVELDWTGTLFHGARALQFGILVGQDENYESNWDASNDYSRIGLDVSEEFGDTDRIPVYFEDELVYGKPYDENAAEPDDTFLYGDVNSDKEVDLTDLSFLSLYILGETEFTKTQEKAADVTADGDVNVMDLARLKQYVSNMKGITLGPKK